MRTEERRLKAILHPKGKLFIADILAVFKKHKAVLVPEAYDRLQVWELERMGDADRVVNAEWIPSPENVCQHSSDLIDVTTMQSPTRIVACTKCGETIDTLVPMDIG